MKKVVVVTGTRADYGIYYPILSVIENEATLDLNILVTGMHLSPQHGYTVENIKQDGFKISAQVDCLFHGSTNANMARSIGIAILGMTQALESIQPDCVIVLGDRGEMLAASIVSAHMNIPVLHLHGGEVSGTIDESIRHAISKLAHIHLVSTEKSRERLIRLGEDKWRIHIVGAPRIETIENTNLPNLEDTKVKFGLDFSGEYLLLIYHPVTTETTDIEDVRRIVEVMLSFEMPIICVLPNSDAGSDTIMKVYKEFSMREEIYCVSNFDQLSYLTILKHAEVLVGNSSSGIIEAASFHVPVINIGNRQGNRERSSNVIDTDHNKVELKKALTTAQSEEFRQSLKNLKNVYGKDNTSLSILNIIKELNFSQELIQKTITY